MKEEQHSKKQHVHANETGTYHRDASGQGGERRMIFDTLYHIDVLLPFAVQQGQCDGNELNFETVLSVYLSLIQMMTVKYNSGRNVQFRVSMFLPSNKNVIKQMTANPLHHRGSSFRVNKHKKRLYFILVILWEMSS
ncbi:hypothetical protein Anapl_05014 [Anas platyrhynchos]|uniref:Uncharacterized protein n=1 Tax=Anas platyrhynchos TaxID=8839 RepID=R0LW46_ANAPL|nr:hypothetical protein Anapl_05014 [Anas platyrhynchos]